MIHIAEMRVQLSVLLVAQSEVEMLKKIGFFLVFFSGISQAASQDNAGQAAFLNDHLTSAVIMVELRQEIIKLVPEQAAGGLIDNYVDVVLMNNIAIITMKDFFHKEYSESETARALYKKNSEKIVPALCLYPPSEYEAYKEAIDILRKDCELASCKCEMKAKR